MGRSSAAHASGRSSSTAACRRSPKDSPVNGTSTNVTDNEPGRPSCRPKCRGSTSRTLSMRPSSPRLQMTDKRSSVAPAIEIFKAIGNYHEMPHRVFNDARNANHGSNSPTITSFPKGSSAARRLRLWLYFLRRPASERRSPAFRRAGPGLGRS